MDRPDVEVAETFFNAMTREIFHTVGVKPEIEFLDRRFEFPAVEPLPHRYRRSPRGTTTGVLFRQALGLLCPALALTDIDGDVAYLERCLRDMMIRCWGTIDFDHVDMLNVLFFRVREARAHHRHGKSLIYREVCDHLERSNESFIVAPGIKGLVFATDLANSMLPAPRFFNPIAMGFGAVVWGDWQIHTTCERHHAKLRSMRWSTMAKRSRSSQRTIFSRGISCGKTLELHAMMKFSRRRGCRNAFRIWPARL